MPGPALLRPDWASGVILAHSLGGLRHSELTDLVKADRAVAEKIPVLDRLMTPEFRAKRPDMAFLFRQMGTFNTAKMQDLTNLASDGPTVSELAGAVPAAAARGREGRGAVAGHGPPRGRTAA